MEHITQNDSQNESNTAASKSSNSIGVSVGVPVAIIVIAAGIVVGVGVIIHRKRHQKERKDEVSIKLQHNVSSGCPEFSNKLCQSPAPSTRNLQQYMEINLVDTPEDHDYFTLEKDKPPMMNDDGTYNTTSATNADLKGESFNVYNKIGLDTKNDERAYFTIVKDQPQMTNVHTLEKNNPTMMNEVGTYFIREKDNPMMMNDDRNTYNTTTSATNADLKEESVNIYNKIGIDTQN